MKGSPGAILFVAIGVFIIVLGYTGKFSDVLNVLKGAPAAAKGGTSPPSGGTSGGGGGGNPPSGGGSGGGTPPPSGGGGGGGKPPPGHRDCAQRLITGGIYFIPAKNATDCCKDEQPITKVVDGKTQWGCSYGSFLKQAEKQGWKLFIGAGGASPDTYADMNWTPRPTGAMTLTPQPNFRA